MEGRFYPGDYASSGTGGPGVYIYGATLSYACVLTKISYTYYNMIHACSLHYYHFREVHVTEEGWLLYYNDILKFRQSFGAMFISFTFIKLSVQALVNIFMLNFWELLWLISFRKINFRTNLNFNLP